MSWRVILDWDRIPFSSCSLAICKTTNKQIKKPVSIGHRSAVGVLRWMGGSGQSSKDDGADSENGSEPGHRRCRRDIHRLSTALLPITS